MNINPKLLKNVNEQLDTKQDLLEIQAITKNVGIISAGQDKVVDISLDNTYTNIGIVGVNFGGSNYTYLSMTSNYVDTNSQATIVLHNFGSQDTGSITLIVYVLRYKTA